MLDNCSFAELTSVPTDALSDDCIWVSWLLIWLNVDARFCA